VCLIVNTAEYCNETMPHLEDSLKKVGFVNLVEFEVHTSANLVLPVRAGLARPALVYLCCS
jgi:hypothetical protein